MGKKIKYVIIILCLIIAIIMCIVYKSNSNKETLKNLEQNIQEDVNKDTVKESESELPNDGKIDISDQLYNTKTLDELEVTNIRLEKNNGITTLLADVINNTNFKVSGKKVKVEILDKNENVIATLKGLIEDVKPNGKVELNMSVTVDVLEAKDFRISSF